MVEPMEMTRDELEFLVKYFESRIERCKTIIEGMELTLNDVRQQLEELKENENG